MVTAHVLAVQGTSHGGKRGEYWVYWLEGRYYTHLENTPTNEVVHGRPCVSCGMYSQHATCLECESVELGVDSEDIDFEDFDNDYDG